MALLISFLVYHFKHDNKSNFRIPVNGFTILLFGFVSSVALISSHRNYAFKATSTGDIISYLGSAWALLLFIILLVMVLKSTGRVFYNRLLKKYLPNNYLLDISLGLIAFTLALFVLGLFGGIQQNTIIALMFGFSLINLFYLVQSLKRLLFKSIDVSGIGILGIVSFCVLIFYLLLNYLSILAPFPSGFDSRNFYVNISQLVADNHGLVKGYQPYYWSLLMSIGFALFEKIELALGLSFLGIVLSLLAAYRLAIRHLKLEKDIVLFLLCLFTVTPAVTNQMYIELKVDFAMLFFQLVCLDYSLILFKRFYKIVEESSIRDIASQLMPLVILLGLLSSFALGIKMINMFMVFTILVLFWWNSKNIFGTLAVLAFSLLLFLFAGIDEVSGLNKYHLSESTVKWVLFILMIVGFVLSFIKHRKATVIRGYLTAVYIFCCGILVMPWMIKNYSETRSLNPRTLLMGKDPGPGIGLNDIINNFNNKTQ